MDTRSRTVEEVLAALAGRAHGVVTRQRLLRAGVSDTQIRKRVWKGLLITEYPGVYRVGHAAPSVDAYYLAAVLACGDGAVLSGRAAAHTLGLVKGPEPRPEVTTPTERRVKGVRTRRCRRIDRRDLITVRGIRATSVPRTLVDIAGDLAEEDLAAAFHEAEVRYRTKPAYAEAVLARLPNRRGAKRLRAVIHGEVRVTLSRLERAFLALLREEVLPLPETNRLAGGRRVDCRWRERALTIELDSYRYHNSRHAWERDRRREREARARKDEFRRYTWADVFEDRRQMLAELRELLGNNPAL